MTRIRIAAAAVVALLLGGSLAGAYLVSNSNVGTGYIYESLPIPGLPLLVDTEAIPGVSDPLAVTQDLMNQWNAVPQSRPVFGTAVAGGPYNGSTVGITFGTFTNALNEVAWDDTGEILSHFGLGGGVLGITLKSVDVPTGAILDYLVVINTRPGALSAPGTGATAEDLFRATLLHELGHAAGLAHTAVGISNSTTYGLRPVPATQMPTMFAYRFTSLPQEGKTLAADDETGFARIYPADPSGRGSISGTVRAPSGFPIDGVAVRAVGPAGTAESHIGVLPNENGASFGVYRIGNLLPGEYQVLIETVNGRAGVDGDTLASGVNSLGSAPNVYVEDEFWEPGDTFDPAVDDPRMWVRVQVRAGRETGSVNFVANARPILRDDTLASAFDSADQRVPDAAGDQHFAEFFTFRGSAGETATLTATRGTLSPFLVPQIRLLTPNLAIQAEELPASGATATLVTSLPQTGLYTVVVFARSVAGTSGSLGDYTLQLEGTGDAVPAAPTVTGPGAALGPVQAPARETASPACPTAMMQVRLTAPSHEELWVDGITLRASGSGDDAADVARVSLVHDANGNGSPDLFEPTLASGKFAADDGTLTLGGLGIELDPGGQLDLLVMYEVTVTSVSSAGLPAGWLGVVPVLALVFLARRRRALALVCLALLLPASCGGSSGGDDPVVVPACVPIAFDANGAITTFAVTIDPGGIDGTTTARDPLLALGLPAAPLTSATLTVSN